MHSRHARRRSPLLLGICLGLGLILLGLRFIAIPWMQEEATVRIATWLEHHQLQLRYRAVRVLWSGIRIEDLELVSPQLTAYGAVEIELGFIPQPKVARLILSDWRIKLQKTEHRGPLPLAGSRQTAHPQLAPDQLSRTLALLHERGIAIEVQSASLAVEDRSGFQLLSVLGLDAQYHAGDASLSFHAKSFKHREHLLLSRVGGQILLGDEKGAFPFLVEAKDHGDAPWQIQGTLSADLNRLDLRHKRKGLPSPLLPYASRFLKSAEELPLLLKLRIDGLSESDPLSFDVQVASNGLFLQHSFLGDEAWGPFPFSLRMKGQFSPKTGDLRAPQGLFHLIAHRRHSPVRIYFEVKKDDLFGSFRIKPWEISLQMPDTPCQILLDVMPHHAFPLLDGFALSGQVGGSAEVKLLQDGFPPLRLGAPSTRCELARVPEQMSRQWLLNRQLTAQGQDPSVLAALRSDTYVPLGLMAEDFLKSVISAEDGGFWRHEGFRLGSLLAAMQANIRAGRVLYGGSTLTMQLAKNLYLSHERVLSRKLQELLIAWALEQQLSKEEILELYANVVEFGPNLRGINRASQTYFAKPAHELNQAEAVFLASILPSPHRHYLENFCTGRLQPKLVERMQKTALGLAASDPEAAVSLRFQEQLRTFQFADAKTHACGRRPAISRGQKSEENKAF